MQHRLSSIALACLFALGAGCVVGDLGGSGDSLANLPEIDCAGIPAWAQGTSYRAGDLVTDANIAFSAHVTHTAHAANWNPTQAASLWQPEGRCGGGGEVPEPGGGGDEGGGDGGGDEPLPPPAEGCQANGRPGPLFDPAGVPNVGNGEGEQFIGGQCLSAADCASGCCALPCGICSGPGAQFQNGKEGCGFGD
jgi:hypothetical protein